MNNAEQNQRSKEKRAVFCFSALVMVAVFGIMLAHRYSTDGYSDYFLIESGRNAAWKIQLGRVAGGAAEAFLHLLGINPVAVQLPFTALFIAVIAWCCSDLWALVIPSFSESDFMTKSVVLLAIFPSFINISFGEFFFFSNCAVHWIGMLMCEQLALRSLFGGNQNGNRISALVLLAISLSFYQAGLGYFVIWGILIVLIRKRMIADRKTVKALLEVVLIGGIAAIVSVFSQKLLEMLHIVDGTERSPGISSMVKNAVYLATVGQRQVLIDGLHFMGTLFGLAVLCLTIWLVVTMLSDPIRRSSAWLVLLCAVVAYGIPFAPHLISSTVWMAPRTIFSIFSYLSFCSLIIIFCIYGKPGRRRAFSALSVVLVAFLFVCAGGVYTIGVEQIRSNTVDKMEALSIVEQIRSYEQKNHMKVNKIGLYRDSQTTYINSESPNAYMDINVRSGAKDWEYVAIVSYYCGTDLETVNTPQEIADAYFVGREWDEFHPEEQVVFDGDTVYLAIY